MDTQPELSWQRGLWESRPLWPSEPSIASLEHTARKHLSLTEHQPCSVAFFAEGAFNKLYEVTAPSRAPCLIRVTLPVEPRLKTLSEAATIEFVRERCDKLRALVPRILAYDADARPYEWMIMEKLPGTVLDARWAAMSLSAKEVLVRDVVACLVELFEQKLRGIGNIYPTSGDGASIDVGRIVSLPFFWDQRAEQDVPRGPFRSSADWLSARLSLVMIEAAQTLATSADEDELEEAGKTQALGRRLVALLPKVFPPDETADPELTVIHHDDLSFHNILVDDDGKLTGFVDWECVSALPLWYACQLPSFLQGKPRMERPDIANYYIGEYGRDMYDEHMREWEQTQLCGVFLAEMARVCPEWIEQHRAGLLRADFELAVACCDSELSRRRVDRWADDVEAGAEPYVSLRDRLF
ncbi:kinase-like protein [Auricularia subglabra TFB-10046 SS5]|nr:kinase-like protein [Auricularia subglabra TFB-10046 SS5]